MSRLGILIGAGSIGKRHAVVMAGRYNRLIVVDINPTAREWAASELSGDVVTVEKLSDVDSEVRRYSSTTTAVIATWGPAHFQTIGELTELGVRQIFCEKPLAVSLKQVAEIRRLCLESKVSLTAGLHLRYRGISDFIRNISQSHLGGLPTTMVVDGGARCIATNGSHWLDLAIDVFGGPPSSVSSLLRSASINPRSADLQFWAGTACWEFLGGQHLAITYDNLSSVHERVCFYTPFGILEVDPELTVRAYRRTLSEIEADSRVIRVGQVERSQSVAEYVPYTGEVLSKQLDEIEGLCPPRYGAEQVLTSAAALITAFEAHRLECRLSFPPTQEIVDQSAEWSIS
nr:Gfo/Idh/MocA family oxidoreductase [Acidobacteriota bacterium]